MIYEFETSFPIKHKSHHPINETTGSCFITGLKNGHESLGMTKAKHVPRENWTLPLEFGAMKGSSPWVITFFFLVPIVEIDSAWSISCSITGRCLHFYVIGFEEGRQGLQRLHAGQLSCQLGASVDDVEIIIARVGQGKKTWQIKDASIRHSKSILIHLQ